MTPQSTAGRSAETAVVACLVAVLALAALGASSAGAAVVTQADETTLTVGDAAVEPGENSTVRLSLDRVPEGLAGFEVVLALDEPDAATIAGASYPDDYQPTTDPSIDESGAAVTVEAADLGASVESGATNVTLAVLSLTGEAEGTAELTVTESQVDADDGSRVDPTVDAGTVSVGAAADDGAAGDGGTAGDDGTTGDERSPGADGDAGGDRVPADAASLGVGVLVVLAGLLGVGVFVWRD